MSESESRKMTVTIQVRATPQEKLLLKARADAFGLSIGELVRQTIFKTQPKSITDLAAIQALAATRADMGRVGGLLKGILVGEFLNAHFIHQRQARFLLKEIEAAQAEVLNAVKKLAGKSA